LPGPYQSYIESSSQAELDEDQIGSAEVVSYDAGVLGAFDDGVGPEDRGRLRGGTLEEMTAAAMRAYLGDTLAGKDSHNGVRAIGERGNALLKMTFKALRNISVDPWRIGRIVAAALVLLHFDHARTT
jgi:hypothetical protein